MGYDGLTTCYDYDCYGVKLLSYCKWVVKCVKKQHVTQCLHHTFVCSVGQRTMVSIKLSAFLMGQPPKKKAHKEPGDEDNFDVVYRDSHVRNHYSIRQYAKHP